MNEVLKRPIESDFLSHVAYARALEVYCNSLESQEPVIFCMHWEDRWGCNHYADPKEPHPANAKPLYTHPPQRTEQESVADDFFRMIADRNPKPFPLPQRTWVGLTGEDFSAIKFSVEMRFPAEFRAGARWADAYLKQKNGYAEEKNT
jgi:hypothetical protein